MTKFEYDEEGKLVVIRDGKKIGEVITMGDIIESRPQKEGENSELRVQKL